jgi:hypothetical protein
MAISVTAQLRASGVDIVWFRDFWEYLTIQDTIAGCAAMLVAADRYYFSSTGKMIELCYAAGQVADTRPPIDPIPIFILPVDSSYEDYRHLERPGKWTILEPDAGVAAGQILAMLGSGGRTADEKSK